MGCVIECDVLGRFSTMWRVLRLVLAALVVLAPVVHTEPRTDRIALVQGGRGPEARPVQFALSAESPRTASRLTSDETFRATPRAAPVARFLLHRALLN